MKKLFSTLLSVLLVGTAIAQSQPQVIFTGTPYGVMGISSNNRYICGTKKGEMAYRFDIETQELITIQAANGYSDMCASDIMNCPIRPANGQKDWPINARPTGSISSGIFKAKAALRHHTELFLLCGRGRTTAHINISKCPIRKPTSWAAKRSSFRCAPFRPTEIS